MFEVIRFALADAGDSLEDANFAVDSANNAILTLTGEEVNETRGRTCFA